MAMAYFIAVKFCGIFEAPTPGIGRQIWVRRGWDLIEGQPMLS